MGSWRVLVAAVAASAALHAAPPLFAAARNAWRAAAEPLLVAQVGLTPPRPELTSPAAPRSSPEAIARARRQLVEHARAARKEDRLGLGDFLLRAAAIDAEELGLELDIAEARRRYEEGLARVQAALHTRTYIYQPFRIAWGRLHYQSIGGSMADALLDGGGSCEQLSHLVAASMYDAGLKRQAYLRHWGGGHSGAQRAHLAPIYRNDAGIEADVVAGGPPQPGGVLFPAADLIEVYARKHGLAPPLAAGAAAQAGWSDGRPSFAGGYPPNADGFPVPVPLFAMTALAPAGPTRQRGDDHVAFTSCWIEYARTRDEVTVVPLYERTEEHGAFTIERVPIAPPGDIEAKAWQVSNYELDVPRLDGLPRMFLRACLSAAYEDLATAFTLDGKRSLAVAAIGRARVLRGDAASDLAEIDWNHEHLKELLERDDAWLVRALPGGLEVALAALEDLGGRPMTYYWASLGTAPLFLELLRDAAMLPRTLEAFDTLDPFLQLSLINVFCDDICQFFPENSEVMQAKGAIDGLIAEGMAGAAATDTAATDAPAADIPAAHKPADADEPVDKESLRKGLRKRGMPERFIDAFVGFLPTRD